SLRQHDALVLPCSAYDQPAAAVPVSAGKSAAEGAAHTAMVARTSAGPPAPSDKLCRAERGQLCCGLQPADGTTLIIHGTPNLSTREPKPGDQKVSPNGMIGLPPSDS